MCALAWAACDAYFLILGACHDCSHKGRNCCQYQHHALCTCTFVDEVGTVADHVNSTAAAPVTQQVKHTQQNHFFFLFFLTSCLIFTNPGIDILTVPTNVLIMSISGTAFMSSFSRGTMSVCRESSSVACEPAKRALEGTLAGHLSDTQHSISDDR